jgi:hypothetical protein
MPIRVKGATHAHLGPIWYLSEPSVIPYSLNQFFGWDFFLAVSYTKPALALNSDTTCLVSGVFKYAHGSDSTYQRTFLPGKNFEIKLGHIRRELAF